jgi:hypothetical protein
MFLVWISSISALAGFCQVMLIFNFEWFFSGDFLILKKNRGVTQAANTDPA